MNWSAKDIRCHNAFNLMFQHLPWKIVVYPAGAVYALSMKGFGPRALSQKAPSLGSTLHADSSAMALGMLIALITYTTHKEVIYA